MIDQPSLGSRIRSRRVLLPVLIVCGFVLGQLVAWSAGNTQQAWNQARMRANLVYLEGACAAAFRTGEEIAAAILEEQGGKLFPTDLRLTRARNIAAEVIRRMARTLPLSGDNVSDLCARGVQPWEIRPRG